MPPTETAEPLAVVTLTLADITKKYVELRNRMAEMKNRHKEELSPYAETMAKLERFMLGQLQTMGADSVKTPHGTPYISTRTSATVADWPAYWAWLQAQDAANEGVDHKANKTYVESIINATGDVPPGINWTVEKVVNVRAK